MLQQESYFIPIKNANLHLKRIYKNSNGIPVFALHGAIENGRIFYSKNLKGFAPYLAEQGYDVYIGDLRGRGLSQPNINRHARYGQTEAITEDIPAFINQIIQIRGAIKQYWIAHSWGGVLLSSYFARFTAHRELVDAMVYFATKRRVAVMNWERLFYVDLMWEFVCPILAGIAGYLPAKRLHMGSDDETRQSLEQSITWVNTLAWRDQDGFDYGAAIRQINLPPIYYLTGIADKCLGHVDDVRRFMQEAGQANAKLSLLSKSNGNLHDYGHIDILTHPDGVKDHFPKVLAWLQQFH